MSLANVLHANSPTTSTALSSQQAERVVVEMSPHCWSPDTVPELGPDRKVVRSQPLLDFERGGLGGKGFQHCLGLRYKSYKWLGESNRVFRWAVCGRGGEEGGLRKENEGKEGALCLRVCTRVLQHLCGHVRMSRQKRRRKNMGLRV